MILSVTPAYTEILVKQGKRSGLLLRNLKANIEEPLAAILTLNTIAHTADAVGAGAQAAIVFGSAGLGVTGPKYSKTLRYIFFPAHDHDSGVAVVVLQQETPVLDLDESITG